MCSISGSFDKTKLLELIELNAYRGTHSHSIMYYDCHESRPTWIQRGMGPIDPDKIEIPNGEYCIVHQQAPTSENKDTKAIHPAEIDGFLLYHNGILKDSTIKKLQEEYNDTSTWDTRLLLRRKMDSGILDDIDGSFSCVYYDPNPCFLYLFRNRLAPMFIDDKSNISSTKFMGSEPIKPDAVYIFDPSQNHLIKTEEFETINLPWVLH